MAWLHRGGTAQRAEGVTRGRVDSRLQQDVLTVLAFLTHAHRTSPANFLRRYCMANQVAIEQLPEGLLLHGTASLKFSLKQACAETARAQATATEN